MMQRGQDVGSIIVGKQQQVIVAIALTWPDAVDASGAKHAFVDEPFEHHGGVRKQVASRGSDDVIIEDVGVLAGQFPGHEERRPVDVRYQVGKRYLHRLDAKAVGYRVAEVRPIQLQFIGASRGQAQQFRLAGPQRHALPNRVIFLAYAGDVTGLQFIGDQLSCHAHRA